MGLQAVRQGQITNNWLKQGHDYWLRKIEDKQLFLRLPRHPPRPTPPGLRHTAETLLYLWWSMGETPGPLLQELLLPLSACVASPRSKRYTWFFFLFYFFYFFFFSGAPASSFWSRRDSHPLTLTKGQSGFVSISMSSRQEGITATDTTFTLQHKVQYWLHFLQWIDCRELQKKKKWPACTEAAFWS